MLQQFLHESVRGHGVEIRNGSVIARSAKLPAEAATILSTLQRMAELYAWIQAPRGPKPTVTPFGHAPIAHAVG